MSKHYRCLMSTCARYARVALKSGYCCAPCKRTRGADHTDECSEAVLQQIENEAQLLERARRNGN